MKFDTTTLRKTE